MTLQAGYPTPIKMSDVMYWARWMAGVYWHHVCWYGQPVGSNELLEATVTSDILLRKELFLRSVMIKQLIVLDRLPKVNIQGLCSL